MPTSPMSANPGPRSPVTPRPTGYPVVTTATLAPPEGRFAPLRRRNPRDLPEVEPHQALVLSSEGQFIVKRSQHFTGKEPEIVNATSVSVVDMTERRVLSVSMELPSHDPAEGFLLTVWFHCSVTNASTVVERGLTDLEQTLKRTLQSYPALVQMGTGFHPSDLDGMRRMATATIESIKVVEPITIPGMTVKMTSCDVGPSSEVRKHAESQASLERQHYLERRRFEEAAWVERERVRQEEGLSRVRQQEREAVINATVRHREELRARGPMALEDAYEATRSAETTPMAAAEFVRRERAERERLAYERVHELELHERERQRQHYEWDREQQFRREERQFQLQTKLIESLAKDGYFGDLPPGPATDILRSLGLNVSDRDAIGSSAQSPDGITGLGQGRSGEVAGAGGDDREPHPTSAKNEAGDGDVFDDVARDETRSQTRARHPENSAEVRESRAKRRERMHCDDVDVDPEGA